MRSHRLSAFAMFCAASLGGLGITRAAIINGGDYGGGNLTPSNGDILSGTFTNVGTFTIPAGATVFENPGTALTVFANQIFIDGTLNGNGAGFSGGAHAQSGNPGSGPGGGQGGTFGANAHASGGAGGGYGGTGGNGAWFNLLGTAQAQGGSSYGTANFSSPQFGSGGGGAGDHGSPLTGTGGNGGAGGGAISLHATTLLDLEGTISAEGSRGQQGTTTDGFSVSGGGGGSGGGILLAGQQFILDGSLDAIGGVGANFAGPSSGFGHGGGGGGGGRLALYFTQANVLPAFTQNVAGGIAGLSDQNTTAPATSGGIGTIYYATTPEPTSLALIAIGAVGLLARRRRAERTRG